MGFKEFMIFFQNQARDWGQDAHICALNTADPGSNSANKATPVEIQLYSASHLHKYYFSTPLLGHNRGILGREWEQCQRLKFTPYDSFITFPSHTWTIWVKKMLWSMAVWYWVTLHPSVIPLSWVSLSLLLSSSHTWGTRTVSLQVHPSFLPLYSIPYTAVRIIFQEHHLHHETKLLLLFSPFPPLQAQSSFEC